MEWPNDGGGCFGSNPKAAVVGSFGGGSKAAAARSFGGASAAEGELCAISGEGARAGAAEVWRCWKCGAARWPRRRLKAVSGDPSGWMRESARQWQLRGAPRARGGFDPRALRRRVPVRLRSSEVALDGDVAGSAEAAQRWRRCRQRWRLEVVLRRGGLRRWALRGHLACGRVLHAEAVLPKGRSCRRGSKRR